MVIISAAEYQIIQASLGMLAVSWLNQGVNFNVTYWVSYWMSHYFNLPSILFICQAGWAMIAVIMKGYPTFVGFSPAQKFPQAEFAPYDNRSYEWNPIVCYQATLGWSVLTLHIYCWLVHTVIFLLSVVLLGTFFILCTRIM